MADQRVDKSPVWQRPRLILGVLLVGLLVLGVALTLAGVNHWLTTNEELNDTLIRSGLQVAVVAVVGAVATSVLRSIEDLREGSRLATEQRKRILAEIIEAYNATKSVRRNLRALGVTDPPERWRSSQTTGIRSQMDRAITAQLRFEALTREVRNTRPFAQSQLIQGELEKIEDYLNDSLSVPWERAGLEVWADESAIPAFGEAKLAAFLARTRDDPAFDENVAQRVTRIEKLIQAELARSSHYV